MFGPRILLTYLTHGSFTERRFIFVSEWVWEYLLPHDQALYTNDTLLYFLLYVYVLSMPNKDWLKVIQNVASCKYLGILIRHVNLPNSIAGSATDCKHAIKASKTEWESRKYVRLFFKGDYSSLDGSLTVYLCFKKLHSLYQLCEGDFVVGEIKLQRSPLQNSNFVITQFCTVNRVHSDNVSS